MAVPRLTTLFAMAVAPKLGAQMLASPPALELAFEAQVSVQTPLVVGQTSHGLRRVVPITGGTFQGPAIRGRVVPGGADWQVVRPDGALAVEAAGSKYAWLNESVFVGLAERRPDAAIIRFYRVR